MRALLAALVAAGTVGCTSWALERSTVNQAESAMDLRYSQVVENLAMVYVNPTVLPAYSTVYSGTADVNDNLKLTSQTSWVRTAIPFGYMTAWAAASGDLLGSRTVKNTWALDPTIVPEKLRAMRAACCWVTHGPSAVGPDIALLGAYQPPDFRSQNPGSPKGYYFGVIDKLTMLPEHWLNWVDRRRDVPLRACYWAGCNGKYVWVGPEGMEGLSQFSLIIQGIARVDFSTLYFPAAQTRTIIKHIPIDPHTTIASFAPPGSTPPVNGPKNATVTFYVDEDGLLTPGSNLPAIPSKVRFDNVGQLSQLTSVINASSKSP